jgi:hypothetical protein
MPLHSTVYSHYSRPIGQMELLHHYRLAQPLLPEPVTWVCRGQSHVDMLTLQTYAATVVDSLLLHFGWPTPHPHTTWCAPAQWLLAALWPNIQHSDIFHAAP